MKRSRRSTTKCTIIDLPEEILIDILSRLSIKTIVTSRCVCKTWCNLLTSSNFTKFHFTRSPVQFLLESNAHLKIYYHITELKDDTDLDKGIKPFPLRFMLDKHFLIAVNSCNGFLCLAVTSHTGNPVIICNPITGEYLNLPKYKKYDYKDNYRIVSGFGFCPKTNQYKVVRLVHRREHNNRMVEVYTIGTRSWRTIGTAPQFSNTLRSTTFFNGAIHWVSYSSGYITSFDLESEKFGVVPLPPHFSAETITKRYDVKIGVLGEFLYLSCNMELWVMKEYGVGKSWDKVCVVDRPADSHQAIKFLSGGQILMKYDDNRLFSYDPVEKVSKESKFLKKQRSRYYQSFAHVPSFMSFNDAMMGDKAAKLRTKMCRVRIKGRDY